MAAAFTFEHSLSFAPERAAEILRSVPATPGVFALFGATAREGGPASQPYLTRTANLRRRMARLLSSPDAIDAGSHESARPQLSRRLNLSARVARIEYTVTGSEFESLLLLYRASSAVFGLDEARRHLKLRTPYFLRFAAENDFPRLYSTNRLTKRSLAHTYGPFPSRAAADRYCEAVEDLFLIRRCHEELHPAPDHPGCIYGEMGKCLAPCNQAQVPANAEAYAAEAAAVEAFLSTRGESLLAKLTVEREQASTDLNFERAAEIHTQIQKVKAAIALADELVAPIPKLRAVIIQTAAQKAVPVVFNQNSVIPSEDATVPGASESRDQQLEQEPTAALFLLEHGCLFGPARLSTLGVRVVREQTAVGSSLFAQPLMLSAMPLHEDTQPASGPVILSESRSDESKDRDGARIAAADSAVLPTSPASQFTLSPEARASSAIATLEAQAGAPHLIEMWEQKGRAADLATLSDHLSLLRRWYYRPEKQRAGEVFFPKADGSFPKAEGSSPREAGSWPVRRILRAAARAALGEPALLPEIHRDLAQRNPADTLPPAPSP